MTFMQPFPDDFFAEELGKSSVTPPVQPQHREEKPVSWLAYSVKWLRAEGESDVIQIARKILAFVLAALLSVSVVGIFVVVDAVSEWKHQDGVAATLAREEAAKKSNALARSGQKSAYFKNLAEQDIYEAQLEVQKAEKKVEGLIVLLSSEPDPIKAELIKGELIHVQKELELAYTKLENEKKEFEALAAVNFVPEKVLEKFAATAAGESEEKKETTEKSAQAIGATELKTETLDAIPQGNHFPDISDLLVDFTAPKQKTAKVQSLKQWTKMDKKVQKYKLALIADSEDIEKKLLKGKFGKAQAGSKTSEDVVTMEDQVKKARKPLLFHGEY